MNRSLLTSLKVTIVALVLGAFASTSFAAVDMFLQIKDEKGKVVSRCEVSKDGSFSCPALPAGEYTCTLEWSWGASNPSSVGSSGMSSGKRGITSSMDAWQWRKEMEGKVMLTCTVKAPRDAASGQASGKRQYQPIRIIKQIDKSTPLLAKALDKSSPQLLLGTMKIDEDCDGISGKISGQNGEGASIEIESWSWGVSNSGSTR